MYSARAITLAT